MTKSGLVLCVSFMGAVLVGCSPQTPPTTSTSAAKASSSAAKGLAKPSATADDNTWGTYLSKQGKMHGEDVEGHPYIYLIPGGDSAAASTRRKEEAQSITFAIGPIVIPGSLLVMGGPDAQQTNALVTTLPKTIKANALKGVVVLIVSDGTQEAAITKAFEPTGATLRFVAM